MELSPWKGKSIKFALIFIKSLIWWFNIEYRFNFNFYCTKSFLRIAKSISLVVDMKFGQWNVVRWNLELLAILSDLIF